MMHQQQTQPPTPGAPPDAAMSDRATPHTAMLDTIAPAPAPPSSGAAAGTITRDVPVTLSPSSARTFLECPAKWFYSRRLELPDPPGSAAAIGTAIHAAAAALLSRRAEAGEHTPDDEEGARAAMHAALDEELTRATLYPTEKPGRIHEKADDMFTVWARKAAPRIKAAQVETAVTGQIGGVDIHAVVDVITTDGCVIDLKTRKKRPHGLTAMESLQLITYGVLTCHTRARIDGITTTDYYPQHLEITSTDYGHAARVYEEVAAAAARGDVSPNRTAQYCSWRTCPYAARCEEDYGGRVSR